MWWAGPGHRSRSLPAWYCDQPHHLLHVGVAFCEQQTVAQRVDKARPLLDAIAELPEPQTGLLLLRHCASFCKVVYATRVTPSTCLGSAMETFDTAVRHCLEAVCTGPLSAEAWLKPPWQPLQGAGAAPRLHPCPGGICFQCPCHPAALPAVRSRLPSTASCGRSLSRRLPFDNVSCPRLWTRF